MISATRKPVEGWLDTAAVAASVLCTVHCLLLPVLIAAMPALSRWLELGEGFHFAVLVFATPVSGLALIGGWRRHRSAITPLIGVVGLGLMAGGLAVEAAETLLTVMGSLLVAGAHLLNWKLRRRAR